jgi:hypothetical protein
MLISDYNERISKILAFEFRKNFFNWKKVPNGVYDDWHDERYSNGKDEIHIHYGGYPNFITSVYNGSIVFPKVWRDHVIHTTSMNAEKKLEHDRETQLQELKNRYE